MDALGTLKNAERCEVEVRRSVGLAKTLRD
jgi:hypothetical protein